MIELYHQPTAPHCWPVTLTLARIYLAHSQLHEDGPDAAADALAPVFTIPAEQRIPQTTHALGELGQQLRARPFATVRAARDLADAIQTFTTTAPVQARR